MPPKPRFTKTLHLRLTPEMLAWIEAVRDEHNASPTRETLRRSEMARYMLSLGLQRVAREHDVPPPREGGEREGSEREGSEREK